MPGLPSTDATKRAQMRSWMRFCKAPLTHGREPGRPPFPQVSEILTCSTNRPGEIREELVAETGHHRLLIMGRKHIHGAKTYQKVYQK